ncbi:AraC family transcriptional regulator [Actibacterium pelagium]|uniref:AraC family transcriptional regulator n=1 Tax=Actibacterium pelagium TaxID=2029103 RepID=A0A917AIT4_9RHOB|nr:AraC family transcriptional regulator [Actibacterium pelagium]GGE56304.1 AraC family transcriptional regulator [Actibacterium pelagium]
MTKKPISADFVTEALGCAVRAGVDTAALMAAVGMRFPPKGHYSAEEFGQLWRALAVEMGDEFFCLGDRPMRPGAFALMSQSTLSAPTLRVALKRILKFMAVVLDEPYGRLTVEDGQAVIRLTDHARDRSAFAYRTYWIIVHGLTCWLAGRRLPLLRVDFACPEPVQYEDYRQFFGAPVQFDASQSLLAFDARHLDIALSRTERELKGFLRKAPANILVGYVHDTGFQGEVTRILRATPPRDWPRFHELAAQLKTSVPTLRRNLAQQGTSYQDIKDTLRRSRARALLKETSQPVEDIATELGFSEPSAFYRAFRKWTGQTPDQFRRGL